MTIQEIMEREEFQPLKLFLTDRGDYQRFMYNAEEYNTKYTPSNESTLLREVFIWGRSNEGFNYWNNLAIEYSLEYIKSTELDKYIENNSHIIKDDHSVVLKHPTKDITIYIGNISSIDRMEALVNNKIIIVSDKVAKMLELDSIRYVTIKKTPYIYYEYFNNTLWGTTTKGKRVEAKVGKLIKAIMPEYDDTKVSEMVDTFRLYGKPFYLDNIYVEDDICSIYDESTDDRGSIGCSCMNDCGRYYKVIEDMGVKVAVLFENDVLLGRALLWDMEDIDGTPYKVMDRIYYCKESVLNSFKAYAIQEGYYRKAKQSNDESCRYDFISPDGKEEELTLYSKAEISQSGESYPYLDTFFNIDFNSGVLTNSSSDTYPSQLRCTDGSDTEGNFSGGTIFCERCWEYNYDDDMIYTESGEVLCSACIDTHYFCDPSNGEYYHNHLGKYCTDTNQIHHEDDVYYCYYTDEFYSDEDNMPAIVDRIDTGETMLEEDAYFCEEDGEYYEEEDNMPKDEEEEDED